MHDIDRTQLESESFETGGPGEFGEAGEFGEFGEASALEVVSPLNEMQEMELASELLEASSEAALEQFLGNVFRKVGGAVGRFVRTDTGQALGGILRGAARQALPVIGRGIGQWISPERGGRLGADAGRLAGRILGLELEGLSPEDREFEIARQFVRFAGAATRQASVAPSTANPLAAARDAAAAAARSYAPGFLPRLQGRSTRLWPRSGRWVRRGRAIILYGG